MADQVLFYYIGDDEAYYRTLESEFKKLTRLSITFKKIFSSDEAKIQSLIIDVYQDKPTCVFIDFSKFTQEYLHLARLLTRLRFENRVLYVGLLDLLTPSEVVTESLIVGMNLSHFKSPEIYDVVFDITKILAPDQIGEHGFATAAFKETWKASAFCKIGYVHADGMHFETDFPLTAGQPLILNHAWLEKKIVPSRQIEVKKVTEANLYYQFKYAIDADYKFIDELIIDPAALEQDTKDREEDRKELIRRSRKLFFNWLEGHESLSQRKIAKVLIVDREFHFYRDQKRVDKLPYVVRSIPHMDDVPKQLVHFCPQVIAVSLDDEETENAKNNFEFLERLISSINKDLRDVDKPFLVLFNTPLTSKALQAQLGYPQLMSASNELSVDILLRMAAIFEKKLTETAEQTREKKTKQVFIKKTNQASQADFDITIDVIKLSETDILFQSTAPIPEGINLRLRTPVPMVISVWPTKTQGKIPEFLGYIHCLSEEHKKELRRYVNSVFFRDHDAQVSTEKEEFKKLNEAKQKEKLEALKKMEEQKAKDAAKAAADKENAEREKAEKAAAKEAEAAEKLKAESKPTETPSDKETGS